MTYGLAKDYFEKGKFQALVLLGSEKNPLLPNVPLASEYGLKNIDCSKFFWLGVHPDTPDEIVDILANALEKVTKDPEYIKTMEENFLTVKFIGKKDAQNFANKFYKENIEKYKDEFLQK